MDENLIDNLKSRLSSSDPSLRTAALVIIGKSRGYELIHATINILESDDDDDVRAMAAWALDQLGSPDTVPALTKATYDLSFGVRSNAGWALVHIGRRVFPNLVVPDVIEILKDTSNYDARQMAYLILTRIGGETSTQAIKTYWN